MSTRPAPTAACIGTCVVLMHFATAGVVAPHRALLPHTGVSRIQRVIGDVAPVPAAVLLRVGRPTARRGVVAAP